MSTNARDPANPLENCWPLAQKDSLTSTFQNTHAWCRTSAMKMVLVHCRALLPAICTIFCMTQLWVTFTMYSWKASCSKKRPKTNRRLCLNVTWYTTMQWRPKFVSCSNETSEYLKDYFSSKKSMLSYELPVFRPSLHGHLRRCLLTPCKKRLIRNVALRRAQLFQDLNWLCELQLHLASSRYLKNKSHWESLVLLILAQSKRQDVATQTYVIAYIEHKVSTHVGNLVQKLLSSYMNILYTSKMWRFLVLYAKARVAARRVMERRATRDEPPHRAVGQMVSLLDL